MKLNNLMWKNFIQYMHHLYIFYLWPKEQLHQFECFLMGSLALLFEWWFFERDYCLVAKVGAGKFKHLNMCFFVSYLKRTRKSDANLTRIPLKRIQKKFLLKRTCYKSYSIYSIHSYISTELNLFPKKFHIYLKLNETFNRVFYLNMKFILLGKGIETFPFWNNNVSISLVGIRHHISWWMCHVNLMYSFNVIDLRGILIFDLFFLQITHRLECHKISDADAWRAGTNYQCDQEEWSFRSCRATEGREISWTGRKN